ncbi:MAG: succinate dehydrogenase/fumarate reductase iron-sulfur subunit [Candidatus Anammoxibacter sp.]
MKNIKLNLLVWRQKDKNTKGKMESYIAENISTDMSFLEMLDVVNEDLIKKGIEPIEFDSDCREGICGTCGVVINGQVHGPKRASTVCQLHMRNFDDGDKIVIEPLRARAFPVVKDLVIDRSSFDRIIMAGGFVSVNTGGAPDANSIQVKKEISDIAMDAAACIGCGACVASCPNASASLFTSAKISHLALLPQGKIERKKRAENMVSQMDKEKFGDCSNVGECEAACPKEISISNIARMKREYFKAVIG